MPPLKGRTAGGLVFGWLGDRIGRVRTMALSILAYGGFTGCCALATEPWHVEAGEAAQEGSVYFLVASENGGGSSGEEP